MKQYLWGILSLGSLVALGNFHGVVYAQDIASPGMVLEKNAQPNKAQLTVNKIYSGHLLEGESIIQIHYSNDGNYLLSTATDGLAKLWTQAGELLQTFTGEPKSMIFNGAFNFDDTKIMTAAYNGIARIWDIEGEVLSEIKGHTSGVTDARFIGEPLVVVSSSDDGTIRGWSTAQEPLFVVTRPGVSRNLDFDVNNALIAATQDIGEITLLDLTGEVVNIIRTNQGRLNDVSFSPDGQFLISAGLDGTARVFNLSGEETLKLEVLDQGWVTGAAINQDNLLVTVSDDGILRLWNLAGDLIDSYDPGLGRLGSVAFHPNGKDLAIAAYHGTIILLTIE